MIRKTDNWKIDTEVSAALERAGPVIALESTVIAHGLPRPRNLETARELEDLVRSQGAVPATVAVVDGVIRVGLDEAALHAVATGDQVEKLSTRELGSAIARRITGATTVASTVHIAERAGIPVFVTGGIGGVHRGLPPDISADLFQLQRSTIICVCAGAKSILDLRATRELLETLGVLVLGWQTDEFPAFYSRESGLHVDRRVDDASGVADIWRANQDCGVAGSMLVCVPVPEQTALGERASEAAVHSALEEARKQNVTGKALTPFLLSHVVKVTQGASLEANLALLRNNAVVAARIAVELAG